MIAPCDRDGDPAAANWKAVTSQPSGTYVRTYPDVYQNLPGNALSTYTTLVQTFTDSVSYSSGTGETASDDWINGNPSTTATINGQNFAVWECSSANCGHTIYSLVCSLAWSGRGARRSRRRSADRTGTARRWHVSTCHAGAASGSTGIARGAACAPRCRS